MTDYVTLIGEMFPDASICCPTGKDPTVYADIVWHTTPIPQATLDATVLIEPHAIPEMVRETSADVSVNNTTKYVAFDVLVDDANEVEAVSNTEYLLKKKGKYDIEVHFNWKKTWALFDGHTLFEAWVQHSLNDAPYENIEHSYAKKRVYQLASGEHDYAAVFMKAEIDVVADNSEEIRIKLKTNNNNSVNEKHCSLFIKYLG
jgi:hypothetical protein